MLRAVGATFVLAIAAVSACTQDFDTFDRRGEQAPSSSPDSTAPPSTSSDSGSSPTNPVEAGGADTGTTSGGTCADKASCFSTGRTCRDGCATTFSSCQTACPQGQAGENCKKDCEGKRKSCESDCSSTCKSCAGGNCDGQCP